MSASPGLAEAPATGLIRSAEILTLADLEGVESDDIGETPGSESYVSVGENYASGAPLFGKKSRDGGRVKKRTLANLSKLPTAAINALRRILRGERLVSPNDAFTCLRSLPHGHVAAVLATVRKLGLAALLARSPGRLRDLVLALLVARVIDAQSKLATAAP